MKIKSSQVILDCHFENNFARGSVVFYINNKNNDSNNKFFELIVKNNHKQDPEKENLGYSEALLSLVKQNKTDSALLLIEKKSPLTAIDLDESGILHVAIKNKNMTLVSALVKAGADLSAKDKKGCTPLELAVSYETQKLWNFEKYWAPVRAAFTRMPIYQVVSSALPLIAFSLFFSMQELINIKKYQGITKLIVESNQNQESIPTNIGYGESLLLAVKRNKTDMALFLIHKNSPLTSKDSDQSGLLHWAIKNKNLEVVCALINAGADVSDKDRNGDTPLALLGNIEKESKNKKDSSLYLQMANFMKSASKGKQSDKIYSNKSNQNRATTFYAQVILGSNQEESQPLLGVQPAINVIL